MSEDHNHSAVSRVNALRRPNSRYDSLAQTLLGDIQAGRYPVGEKLPSESTLQARYGVSRHTVRQALRELKIRGVVSSHPGVGTLVRNTSGSQRLVYDSSSLEDFLNFTRETQRRLLGHTEIVADAALAELLRCNPGQLWYRIELLRHAPQKATALGYVIVYVRPEHAQIVNLIEHHAQPVFSLIDREFGVAVTEVQQEISSVTLDHKVQSLLKTSTHHGLQVVRHYLDENDKLIELSLGLYASTQFSFRSTVRIQREHNIPL